MKNKFISPGMHGLIDYVFGLTLITAPNLLNADKRAVRIYQALALEIFLYSAITRQPYAVKPLIPLQIHKKVDIINLSTLALLSTCKHIHRNKRTLAFNIGMTVLGLATVLLTDWKKQPSQ